MKTELSEENIAFRALIQRELEEHPEFGIEEVRELRKIMTPEMKENERAWFYSHVNDWITIE